MATVLDEFIARADRGRLTTSCDGPTRIYRPASRLDVVVAEAQLGFRLPALLRELYVTVGNGGFGPGYGLFGLCGGAPMFSCGGEFYLVDIYRSFLRRPHAYAPWQERLLPICHWGCTLYSYLDCALPQAPVMSLDENAKGYGPRGCAFALHAHSFEEWMRRFLDGEDLVASFDACGEPKLGFEPDEPPD